METESREIIEKKVYEEGRKNYATKGEALGVGIPALALAGIATANMLFGGRGLNVGGNRMPENIAIAMGGNCGNAGLPVGGPTPYQLLTKEYDDVFAITRRIDGAELSAVKEFAALREQDQREKFDLYKSQRDSYDALKSEIDAIKQSVAVSAAVRPYQDRLIQCEIDKAYDAGVNYVDHKTCRMITGEVVLPNAPTVTGYASWSPVYCPSSVSAVQPSPASGK